MSEEVPDVAAPPKDELIEDKSAIGLNKADPSHFAALEYRIQRAIELTNPERALKRLISETEELFEPLQDDFDPLTLILLLGLHTPRWDSYGIEESTASQIEPVRIKYGPFIRNLVTRATEGPEDWASVNVECFNSVLLNGASEPFVKLQVIRNDEQILQLTTTPSFLVRLVRRLVVSIADMPESHQSDIDEGDLTNLLESVEKLQGLISDSKESV